jgi:hypothetical protein
MKWLVSNDSMSEAFSLPLDTGGTGGCSIIFSNCSFSILPDSVFVCECFLIPSRAFSNFCQLPMILKKIFNGEKFVSYDQGGSHRMIDVCFAMFFAHLQSEALKTSFCYKTNEFSLHRYQCNSKSSTETISSTYRFKMKFNVFALRELTSIVAMELC